MYNSSGANLGKGEKDVFIFVQPKNCKTTNGWMEGQCHSKSSEYATKNDAVDEVKESNHNKDLD